MTTDMKPNEYLAQCVKVLSLVDYVTDNAKIEMFLTFHRLSLTAIRADVKALEEIASHVIVADGQNAYRKVLALLDKHIKP